MPDFALLLGQRDMKEPRRAWILDFCTPPLLPLGAKQMNEGVNE